MSDEVAYNRTLQQVIELFVNPEIKRRLESGKITKVPIPLWGVQVILPGDGSEARVRLNEEIRGTMVAVAKPGVSTELGTQLSLTELATIERIELSEPEDLDAGHITVIWLGDRVFLSFDARRNKDTASKLVKVAAEYLEHARFAMNNSKSWSVFVDSLFSSLELAAKAFLWTMPWGLQFKAKMPHTAIRSAFAQFPAALNNIGGAPTALESLAKERNTARYLHDDIVPDWEAGNTWLKEAEEMLHRASAQVQLQVIPSVTTP